MSYEEEDTYYMHVSTSSYDMEKSTLNSTEKRTKKDYNTRDMITMKRIKIG